MAKKPTKPNKRNNAVVITPNQKPDKRRRVQFKFWLDDNKPVESEMGASLDHLKTGRKFAKFIRDAIRLMLSLMVGDVSVLVELFPGVVESIQADGRNHAAALLATIDHQQQRIEELETQLSTRQPDAITARLESIEKLLQSQGKQVHQDSAQPPKMSDNQGIGLKALKPVAAAGNAPGPKQLAVPTFAAPPPDDDSDDDLLLDIRKDESAAARTTQNFLRSILSLTEEQPDKPNSGSNKALSPRQRRYMEGKGLTNG